ncbi:MAG: hypothetical protein ACE5JU_20335 [Candidatus Binatia bacterium]
MLKDSSDEELKEIIRNLAKAADLNLSEERIEIVLPQFKTQLGWIDSLKAFKLSVEAEPSHVFKLKKRPSK